MQDHLRKLVTIIMLSVFLFGCDQRVEPDKTQVYSGLGVTDSVYSSDLKHALVSTIDLGVQYWDLEARKVLFSFTHGDSDGKEVKLVALADNNPVALTADEESVVIWDTTNGEALRYWALSASPNDIVLSASGGYMAAALANQVVTLLDLSNGDVVQDFTNDAAFTTVALSKDNRYIAMGDEKGRVRVWDLALGKLTGEYAHEKRITRLAFSPDSKRLLSASKHHDILLHDPSSGKQLAKLDTGNRWFQFGGLAPALTAVTFSKNSDRIITGHPAQLVQIFDGQGKRLHRFYLPKKSAFKPSAALILDVKLSADQTHLWTQSTNGLGHEINLVHDE